MIVEAGKNQRGHPYFFPSKFSSPKIKGKSSIIEWGDCSRQQSDFVLNQGGAVPVDLYSIYLIYIATKYEEF